MYDTKVKGLEHLYQSIDPEALRFLILFSSSTARFGRSGQVAYAAANEVLNKWAQQQSVRLPHCRVVSYNWGPWAGGMVNDSLKALFEKEGLSLIPLDAGARLVVDEIRGGGPGPVEVVVLAEPSRRSISSPSAARRHGRARRRCRPKAGNRISPHGRSGLAAGARVARHRRTRRSADGDHPWNGWPRGPSTAIRAWWCAASTIAALQGSDHRREPRGHSRDPRGQGRPRRRLISSCPPSSEGTLANGREVAHARADVVLADRHETAPRELTEGELLAYPLSRDEIYQTILFHGPAMQGIERVDGLGERADRGLGRHLASAFGMARAAAPEQSG